MTGFFVGAISALVIGWSALAPAPAAPALAVISCAEDLAACDSDGDGIGDLVEESICGSATCATGDEDTDGDGVADSEQLAESLEQGGPAGPVQLSDPGWVRIVLPGPVVIDVPWWPLAVAVVAGGGVLIFVLQRRAAAREPAGRARHSSTGS